MRYQLDSKDIARLLIEDIGIDASKMETHVYWNIDANDVAGNTIAIELMEKKHD